jgi:hypothetical protein
MQGPMEEGNSVISLQQSGFEGDAPLPCYNEGSFISYRYSFVSGGQNIIGELTIVTEHV